MGCGGGSSRGHRLRREGAGGLLVEHEAGRDCLIVGTGPESADDWIAREAAGYQPYWLVTSDRDLRARAGTRAQKLLGGGSFARTLAP